MKKFLFTSFFLTSSFLGIAQTYYYTKKITPPNTSTERVAGDNFGRSVGISGNYAIVGAHKQDRDSANGNYKADAGAACIFERQNGTWGFVKKLSPPNTDSARVAGDMFGLSVAISGDYAVVGAPNQDYDSIGGTSRTDAGAAYVFERQNGTWVYVKKITPPNTGNARLASDNFGESVAISGNYIVVGAPDQDYDSAGGSMDSDAGAAYIFERQNGTWGHIKKISARNAGNARESIDGFGSKVAIDGNYILLGVLGQDYDSVGANLKTLAGAAYIFELRNGVWGFAKKISAPDRDAGDQFGGAVSINGNYAILGARYKETDSAGGNPVASGGAAYIYELRNGVWLFLEKITAPATTNERLLGDFFGASVGISGNYVIVGADGQSYDTASASQVAFSGAAYVFELRNGSWNYQKKLVPPNSINARSNSDFMGGAVAISGEYAIAGAINQDYDSIGTNSKTDAGAAFMFEYKEYRLRYDNGWVDGLMPTANTTSHNCYVLAGTATIDTGWLVKTLTVDSGATASLTGDFDVTGNYTNNGTISGTGVVVLCGTSSQKIYGTGVTPKLILNNSSGASIQDSLKISGVFTHTLGTLTTNGKLKLVATGPTTYGQVAGSGTGSISGNLTAEYVISGDSAGYRSISAPVNGATLAELSDDLNLDFGPLGGSTINTYYYNENASPYWIGATGTTESMASKVFSIYMGGTVWWENPLPVTIDITGTYQGTTNYTVSNLDRTGSVTNQSGWHYVRNPWPSGFLWNGVGAARNVTASAGGVQGQQVWVYDNTTDAYRPFSNSVTGVIPPFHPFTLQVTANNTALTIKNSARNTDSLKNYFDKNGLPNFIEITASDAKGNTDNVQFYTDDIATNGYDAEDGNKMMNPGIHNLYFVLEGENANKEVWNTLPGENEPLQLNFESKTAGNYTFSFRNDNIESGVVVELEDKLSKARHNIAKGSYTFTHNPGNAAQRFSLHFIKKSTTAVEGIAENRLYVGSSNNQITVVIKNPGTYTIEVFDLLGRAVHTLVEFNSAGNHVQNITVNGIAAGYYLVKVQGSDLYKTKKVFLK